MKITILNRLFKTKTKKEKTMTGTVKFYNATKGYGFITVDQSTQDVFVHVSGLLDEINSSDRVSFETQDSKKGLNAINVKRLA